MSRLCTVIFAAFILACTARAQQTDSIQLRAATLAARGEVAALRPLYRAHRAELLPQTRLFCELAIARADGHRTQAIACIDSLTGTYARQLDLGGRLALIELKVSILMQEGRYAEAKAVCEKELSYFKRRRMRASRLQPLRSDLRKAARLAPDTPRARMLGLAARGLAFELRPLYLAGKDSLDDYARLRCAWELARAFSRDNEASRHADSLLACYPDSLDANELTLCLRTQAEHFIAAGEWKALQAFCDRHASLSQAHGVRLPYYRRMAEAFGAHPASTVERPPHDCGLPLSPLWPLFVPVKPNGQKAYPFLLDTGQGYTLLPEAEARTCGLHILPDTLSVASPTGLLSVSPAYADSLVLGEIVFRHIVVYAVHPDEYADPLYTRVLGCNELLRLPGMVFYPKKLVFPYRPAGAAPGSGEMRLSADGALRLRAENEGHPYLFGLDTGSSDDVFPSAVFPPATTDTLHFEIAVGDSCYFSPTPFFTDSRATDHDGLLGVPFLRQFRRVCFDFGSMRLSLQGYAPALYAARAEADFADDAYFSLERNEASLLWRADEKDRLFCHLLMLLVKNAPDRVWQLCDRIEADHELDLQESEFLVDARLHALLAKGDEAGVVSLVAQIPAAHGNDSSRTARLRSLAGCYEAASRFAPMEWRTAAGAGQSARILESGTGLCVEGFVRRRKAISVCLSLSDEEASVSEQTARRLKIKPCYKDQRVRFGVLDSLRIGGSTLHNVRCIIRPGKAEGLTLGTRALLQLGYMELAPAGIRLEATPAAPLPAANPMHLFENRFWTEEETPTDYVVSSYTPAGLMEPVRQHGTVRLDFRHMQMGFPSTGASLGGR